jgi:cobalt-zinc-cadmium efflux system outer membrane protein
MSMTGVVLFLIHGIAFSQAGEKLSLTTAILIALQNNEQVLTAEREIEAASGRILQAGRIPNPNLIVAYNEVPTTFDVGGARERDIGISQTIEFPGKRGSRVEAAEIELGMAQFSLKRAQTIVSSSVKRAYYSVLLAAEVVENLGLTISLIGDFRAVVTQRYQAGSSRYLDVIRTTVELTRYENRLSELNLLLGRFPEEPLILADSLTYTPLTLAADSALAIYTHESAVLERAAQEVARGQSLLRLAEKSYLPDFFLGAVLQKRPGEISPTGSSHYIGMEVGVSIPLWFWQGPRGEVQESQAALEASGIRFEATRRRVHQSIGAAYRTAQVAEGQLKVFDASLLRDVEDVLRAGISAYQNNQIDALNLFDIYRTYRATNVEYARALYNFSAAVAQLEAAGELPE